MNERIPSYGILARLAWQHYLLRFDVILAANLLIALPLYILVDVATPRALLDTADVSSLDGILSLVTNPEYFRYTMIELIATVITSYIAIAIVIMMKGVYEHKEETIGSIMQQAWAFYPRVIVVTLVIGVCSAIGYATLIIPGIFVATALVFTIPILVWHNTSIWVAMRKSWKLVLANFWSVLWYILLTELLVSLLGAVIVAALPDSLGFTALALTVISIFNGFTTVLAVLLFSALEMAPLVKKSR